MQDCQRSSCSMQAFQNCKLIEPGRVFYLGIWIYPGSILVGSATLVVANVLTCNKYSQTNLLRELRICWRRCLRPMLLPLFCTHGAAGMLQCYAARCSGVVLLLCTYCCAKLHTIKLLMLPSDNCFINPIMYPAFTCFEVRCAAWCSGIVLLLCAHCCFQLAHQHTVAITSPLPDICFHQGKPTC
jgi:hypothetical protein